MANRVVLALFLVALVEKLEEVQLFALRVHGEVRIPHVGDELFDVAMLGIDVDALVDAGEKGRLPVGGARGRDAIGAEGDEAGQILVFRP